MNVHRERICMIVLLVMVFALIVGGPAYANEEEEAGLVEMTAPEETEAVDEEMAEERPAAVRNVTIIGTVDNDYMLVSKQGVAYGIAETEAGDLMGMYVGELVKAKGIVSEVDDQKFISVTSFDFVDE